MESNEAKNNSQSIFAEMLLSTTIAKIQDEMLKKHNQSIWPTLQVVYDDEKIVGIKGTIESATRMHAIYINSGMPGNDDQIKITYRVYGDPTNCDGWRLKEAITIEELCAAMAKIFNPEAKQKPVFNREQFLDFFRNSDAFNEEMTADDCIELFLGSLKGQSDITHKLLEQLCGNYDSSLEGQLFQSGFAIKALDPLNEVRLLVYKGYECPVIHESAIDELDERAMFVCSDEEWAMSDAELIAKLVKDDVIPESEDELTLAQAVKVVLNNYKDVSSNDDWAKAMAAMQEWIDDEKGLMTEPL